MASAILYKDQFFYVSNSRFGLLIDFGLQVGTDSAKTDQDKNYVAVLKNKKASFYPGYDFAIEKEFPDKDERKFWARVYFDLAYLMFCRKIGNQGVEFAQYSAVGDAYLMARIITRSVQEEEQAWHPRTLATVEAEVFYNKGINVRL